MPDSTDVWVTSFGDVVTRQDLTRVWCGECFGTGCVLGESSTGQVIALLCGECDGLGWFPDLPERPQGS
ncbi:hypothetical protein SAMN05216359_1297 [Roseateles sp. YR242]|nr:hypothetical protein SAMN05216359_1297 [Roseateles sp. YR242]